MIRVAAVGDLHVGTDSRDTLRPAFLELPHCADVLLLAGDLTRLGTEEEIDVLVREFVGIDVPRVAVLGNHDLHSDRAPMIVQRLEDAGVRVLEGTSVSLEVGDTTLGIAGTKGFGGGFAGAHTTDFGEPEMKDFVRVTKRMADDLYDALASLRTDVRIALLHFAPTKDTVRGERLEIFPFLGSYLLGEAIDAAGADLVIHGHAHNGVERGVTPGGIPVRNVALPVIENAYRLYSLGTGDDATTSDGRSNGRSNGRMARARIG